MDLKIIKINDCKKISCAYYFCYLYSLKLEQKVIPAVDEKHLETIIKTVEFLDVNYNVILFEDAKDDLKSYYDENIVSDLETSIFEIYKKINNISNDTLFQVFGNCEKTMKKPIIVALTMDALVQAVKYSMLTQRRVFCLDSIDKEFFETSKNVSSITLFFNTQLDTEKLKKIYEVKEAAANKVPIGMMYPFGNFNKENVITKNFLFSEYNNKTLEFNYFFPLENKNSVIEKQDGHVVIGKDNKKINELLVSSAEFSFATLHSNSVDTDVGDVIICAKKDFHDDTPIKVMPCFKGAVCSRESENRVFIEPTQIKSKILFLYTCWGVGLDNGVYDVSTTLAYQFASSPYVPILITTYTMSLLDRNAGSIVANIYKEGKCIGEAIVEYNEIHYNKYSDYVSSIIMFGDPEIKISSKKNHLLFEKKRITKTYKNNSSDSNEEIYGKEFFLNLDYVDYILNGTEKINIKSLEAKIDTMRIAIRELRMFAILYNRRKMQKMFYANTEEHQKYREDLFNKYHSSWGSFYEEQVKVLGGYIRFQVDNLFSMPKVLHDAKKYNCPYCESLCEIHEKSIEIFDMKKHQIECLNCATIFDSVPMIDNGYIECSKEWGKGEKVSVKAVIKTSISEKCYYYARVILEPFNKHFGEEFQSIETKFVVKSFENSVVFEFEDIYIDQGIVAGCRYINCIVCINESFALLRRPIYIY